MGTIAGTKYYISDAKVADADLADAAAFEALTYVEIKRVGSFPEFGRNEPIASYMTHDSGVLKGKGSNNIGDGDMEVAHVYNDAGQILMRTAGSGKLDWVIKVVHADATGSANPELAATTEYIRCIISGPRNPSGGDEEFVRDVYSLGGKQYLRVLQAVIPA